MEIIDYSEKSIVVIGDTKDIKEQLKELGGRYNPNLTVDGEKIKGWIFSKRKEEEVRNLIEQPSTPKKKAVPSKATSSSRTNVSSSVKYQEITVKVLRPYKGQMLSLYTYPDDDISNVPVATEATVLHVGPSGTKMTISYDGNPNATCIIIDGQWGLYLSSFPNYIDI